MPKLKTKKSAAKRFKSTKTGKLKRRRAFAAHLLTGKSPKRRRRLNKSTLMCAADQRRTDGMLPYGSY